MDIDSVITRLLEIGETCPENMVPLLESEIYGLCFKAREIFLSQPMLLELVPPLKICGDIHAQYSDLLNLFQCGGYPTSSSYLFLGDYVGPKQSLATICLLLAYKVKFPENFFLLRGRQECAAVNRVCGFYDECRRLYSKELWNVFIHCFNCMPVAAIIDEKIFCCHGGLSPELTSLEQIRAIERPTKIPFKGLLCDLLWSDPDKNIFGWTENERGISYKFGVDVVEHFLEKHNLELICRGHQVVPNGYEFYANRKLVTLFSVPNYHDEFDNFGAMMHVSEDLLCSFFVMKRTSTS